MPNLALPGNPRYQPKNLQDYFGYDNLFRAVAQVEIATMKVLGEIGVIPTDVIALLTPEVEKDLLSITTTQVDEVERKITKHDIRAWVRIAQERVHPSLCRWIHIPLTSYDAIDTARSIQFATAHRLTVRPLADEVIEHLVNRTSEFAGQPQIGRTHGQHALPITVGFWLATILNRFLVNVQSANNAADCLIGKISGAVGAYNAQVATGIPARCDGKIFEEMVLAKLGLKPARVSTQIMSPEPLADYLFSCVKISAALGQFGRDGRHLMRTEIGELCEPFDKGQVGSSTMAHKRNPINFENLESTWLKTKNEFGKVLDVMLSDHQRDLVNSAIARDFPTIVVNIVSQLNTLLRGTPCFLERLTVDKEACSKNFALQGDLIMAEPIYITLQMLGYAGDAHELVNHRAIPKAAAEGVSLYNAVEGVLREESSDILHTMHPELKKKLRNPERYLGLAEAKAFEVVADAEDYLGVR